jgi:hypothetical protein
LWRAGLVHQCRLTAAVVKAGSVCAQGYLPPFIRKQSPTECLRLCGMESGRLAMDQVDLAGIAESRSMVFPWEFGHVVINGMSESPRTTGLWVRGSRHMGHERRSPSEPPGGPRNRRRDRPGILPCGDRSSSLIIRHWSRCQAQIRAISLRTDQTVWQCGQDEAYLCDMFRWTIWTCGSMR